MKKRAVILTLVMTFAVLFASCGNAVSPADTVKPPKTSPQVNYMDKYKELKGENASPAEIINFAEENIGNLEKEDADIVIKGVIEAQKLKFKNYQDKLFSEEFNKKINPYSLEDLKTINSIKDEEVKSYLQEAANDGFKFFEAEGMKDLEIDYEYLDNNFSGYLSGDLAAYIGILAKISNRHYIADGAVIIPYDELADRIIEVEDFLENYPETEYRKEMEDLHSQYVSIYLLGLNNTPAFDMDTHELKRDLRQSFDTTKTKYPDSRLAATLTEYLQLLSENGGKRTKEVLQYVGKITGNPQYGSAE